MPDPTTQYAKAVLAGKVVAGKPVRLACERHLRDLKQQKAKGLKWDAKKAQRALEFFPEMLALENGSPFKLWPWQEFVVGSCFGWYNVDGTRRFRTAYVETGKGSGKTPLAAGIGLFGLVADGEKAAEIYSAANDRDQAKIVWKDAYRMVKATPELDSLISSPDRGDVQIGALTIIADSSVFRPVSSEHKGLDGKRVHMALIDELHEHPSGTVVDKMRAGTKARRNALIFEITNSGHDRTSVCWQHHELSLRILQRTVDNEAWFAFVCALDEQDDWKDEKVWPKVNPSLPGVPGLRYLREQVADAVTMPAKQNIVKRLNFCIWTEQSERWLDLDQWDVCGQPARAGRACFAGLKLSSRRDLVAFVLVFGPDEGGAYDVLCRFWIPRDALVAEGDRSAEDKEVLRRWVDQGFIKATEGNVSDYDTIEADVLAALKGLELRELAHDPQNATQLSTHLIQNLGEKRVIDVSPTFLGMSSASKELEKLLASEKIRHGGNPVLRWMAGNVAIQHGPNEQIRPDPENSSDSIVGITALIMGLGRATLHAQEKPSVYESREMITL